MTCESIFTITTLRMDGYQGRSPGWFTSWREADQCVKENWGDIFECGYHYAVIEQVPPGLYAQPNGGLRAEWWYKWNKGKKTYVPITKPDRFKRNISWGIG